MCKVQPTIIGLTGGIACGKSTASQYLHNHHGLPILDADLYAREAVAAGSPILQALKQRYGASVLNEKEQLDRAQLGAIIFNQAAERQWVEGLIHPYVRDLLIRDRDQILQQSPLNSSPHSIIVLVIPLLFESQMQDLVNQIWVVACQPTDQMQRLMVRNHLTEAEAVARIQSQWPLSEKIKRATRVLHNDGDRHQLYAQIDQAIAEIQAQT